MNNIRFDLAPMSDFADATTVINNVIFRFRIDWLEYFRAHFSNRDLSEEANLLAQEHLHNQPLEHINPVELVI